jgi:site-specific DNA-methyltransferase (adenine-specific)
MQSIEDNSIDCILTDPPYLYLKNQKLDRPFDEMKFFNEAKRVLKKDGFIVLFGRGTSFYRWNTRLADLGFTFKEEIVWNKKRCSIPASSFHRVHETISISAKGKSSLNKVTIPYIEIRQYNIDSIVQDIKRIKSAINGCELDDVMRYLKTNKEVYTPKKCKNSFKTSFGERSRGVATLRGIKHGLREKSIIEHLGDHYNAIHPTQKPVRLLERLLALTTKEGDLVLDPFSGSASTAIAACNTNRRFIGFEIDEEYYESGLKRLNNHINNNRNLFNNQIYETDIKTHC